MTSNPIAPEKRRELVGILLELGATSDVLLMTTFQCLTKIEEDLCQAIFFTFDALPPRISLLERILEAIDGDAEDKKILKKITNAAETVNTYRKKVAHIIMTSEGAKPDTATVIHMKNTKNWKYSVTRAELENWRKVAEEALDRCANAYEDLCQKRGIRPVTQPR